jgi:hypothetical protein
VNDEAIFFETPAKLRAWLEEHHATASDCSLATFWVVSAKRPETRARALRR